MVYDGGEQINDLERNYYLRELPMEEIKGEQLNDLRRQWLLHQLNNPGGGATPAGNYHGVIQHRNADGSALEADDAVRVSLGQGFTGVDIFDPNSLDDTNPLIAMGWYDAPSEGQAYGGIGSNRDLSVFGQSSVALNSFGPIRTNSGFRMQGDAHRELRLGKYKNPTAYMGGYPWVFSYSPAHYEQEESFATDHVITQGQPPIPIGSFTVGQDMLAGTWEIHSKFFIETENDDGFIVVLGSVNGGAPFPISFQGVNAGIEETITDAWANGQTGAPFPLSEGDTIEILMQVDTSFFPAGNTVINVKGSTEPWLINLMEPGERAYGVEGIVQVSDGNGVQVGAPYVRASSTGVADGLFIIRPDTTDTITDPFTGFGSFKGIGGGGTIAAFSSRLDFLFFTQGGRISLQHDDNLFLNDRYHLFQPPIINNKSKLVRASRMSDFVLGGNGIYYVDQPDYDAEILELPPSGTTIPLPPGTWEPIRSFTTTKDWGTDDRMEFACLLQNTTNEITNVQFRIVTPSGTIALTARETSETQQLNQAFTARDVPFNIPAGSACTIEANADIAGMVVVQNPLVPTPIFFREGSYAFGAQEGAVQIRRSDGVMDGQDTVRAIDQPNAQGLGFYEKDNPLNEVLSIGKIQDPEDASREIGALVAEQPFLFYSHQEAVMDFNAEWLIGHDDLPVEAPGDEHYYLMGVGPTQTAAGRRAVTFFKVLNAHTDWAEDTTDITFDKESWTSIVAVTATAQYDPGDRFECQALCYATEGEDIFEFRVQGSTVGDIPLGSISLSDGAQGTFTQSTTIGTTIPNGEVLTLQVYTNENDGQQILGATQPSRIVLTKPGGIEGIT